MTRRSKAKPDEETKTSSPVSPAPEATGAVKPEGQTAAVKQTAAPEQGAVDDGAGQRDAGRLTDGSQPQEIAPDRTPALVVASKSRAGIRRAGMWHGPEPVLHEAGSLSVEQIAAIEAEPGLHVRRIEVVESIETQQS